MRPPKRLVLSSAAVVGLGLLVGLGLRSLPRAGIQAGPAAATVTATDRRVARPTHRAINTPSETPSPWPSPLPSLTLTATATATPTATLSTLVVQVTAINADVTLEGIGPELRASQTSAAPPTLAVPIPLADVAALPAGDTPLIGWFELPATDPAIQAVGHWQTFSATYRAVHRRYLYTDQAGARLVYRFVGAAVRVRYVAFASYGVFQIVLDGQVRATLDSYHPRQADGRGNFLSSEVFGLALGWHTLEIVDMGRKAPESSGTYVAIDALDVYLSGLAPTPGPTGQSVTATLTASPKPAESVKLVAAPPTVQPTATAVSPGVSSVDVSIVYDVNGNHIGDLSEGVQNVPVRLVTADTNEVLASGYTSAEGFVHLEATSNATLRLVVPYFNKYWDIPSRNVRLTLLIPPANQPGLIP